MKKRAYKKKKTIFSFGHHDFLKNGYLQHGILAIVSFMKKIFNYIKLEISKSAYLFIFVILVILSVLFLWISMVFYGNGWGEFFINLSAGFVSALVTVFFIDLLKNRNNEIKWAKARDYSVIDLVSLTGDFTNRVAIFFGYTIGGDEEIIGPNLRRIHKSILKKDPSAILKVMKRWSKKDWVQFNKDLNSLKFSLHEYLSIYNEIIRPEQLGCLIATKRDIDFMLTLSEKIELNQKGKNKSWTEVYFSLLALGVRDYFKNAKILSDLMFFQKN